MDPNDITIDLLARIVFGEDKIKKIVTKNKRDPIEWIKGYNACDGTRGVGEIAKLAKVTQPTATVILKSWEEEGILHNIGTDNKPLYKKLIRLKIKK